MIENVSTQLTVFHCFAHCLLPGRAFASLYVLLFLEKEAEIGGREFISYSYDLNSFILFSYVLYCAVLIGNKIEFKTRLFQRTAFYFAFSHFLSKILINCVTKNKEVWN